MKHNNNKKNWTSEIPSAIFQRDEKKKVTKREGILCLIGIFITNSLIFLSLGENTEALKSGGSIECV